MNTNSTISTTYPQQAITLAEVLQSSGYLTADFGTTYCLKAKLGAAQGFDYYDDDNLYKTMTLCPQF